MVVKMRLGGVTRLPIFKSQVEGFDDYFQNQIKAVVENLAKSGVTETKKALRNAKTEWGKSRMAGNHYGVRFAPYGRSEGREDTGYMYDSLRSRVGQQGDSRWRGVWGWPAHALHRAPYIRLQELGFKSAGSFDPVATAASGKARFKEGKIKSIPGAFSLFASRDAVSRRTESAFSAAWNEARIQFKVAGNKSDPGSYLKARGQAILRRALSEGVAP